MARRQWRGGNGAAAMAAQPPPCMWRECASSAPRACRFASSVVGVLQVQLEALVDLPAADRARAPPIARA
eukprot:3645987-Prymnesium_polylepis.1